MLSSYLLNRPCFCHFQYFIADHIICYRIRYFLFVTVVLAKKNFLFP